MDPRTCLDIYVCDYLEKRGLRRAAAVLKAEAALPDAAPVGIDIPGGFLAEWWTVFWEIYLARCGGGVGDVPGRSRDVLGWRLCGDLRARPLPGCCRRAPRARRWPRDLAFNVFCSM